MDRRNFLRTGGMALLGSLAAGSVLAMPSSAKGAMGGGDQLERRSGEQLQFVYRFRYGSSCSCR